MQAQRSCNLRQICFKLLHIYVTDYVTDRVIMKLLLLSCFVCVSVVSTVFADEGMECLNIG